MRELAPHLPHLVSGLAVTLTLLVGGAALALLCSVAAGLGRLSRDPIVRATSRLYIELFRGTSALVQLYWFYFALPLLIGLELSAMTAGVLVLGLNVGAYGAEVVRGAVQAVPAGQHLAARALSLTRYQRLRYVILPQAGLMMMPPMANLLIELLKSTALVSMISVTDLTRAGLDIRDNTLATTELLIILMAVYFLISLAITATMRRWERRWSSHLGEGGVA